MASGEEMLVENERTPASITKCLEGRESKLPTISLSRKTSILKIRPILLEFCQLGAMLNKKVKG
jgi:hypothetical protein